VPLLRRLRAGGAGGLICPYGTGTRRFFRTCATRSLNCLFCPCTDLLFLTPLWIVSLLPSWSLLTEGLIAIRRFVDDMVDAD